MDRTVSGLALAVCLTAFASNVRTEGKGDLPDAWQARDVGRVGQTGSASENSGVFTVSGAGRDVWGTSDGFHFVFRPLTGDGTIVAEVASLQGAKAWTKMGVMIRASVKANAAYAFMLVSKDKGLAFQRRTAAGVASTHTSGGSAAAPRWVRLTRAGARITAYTSADGRSWTRVGSDTIAMPSTALVGLAAHSHDPSRLATATFENVRVTSSARASTPGRLVVSGNNRFLQDQRSGRPVFYLADTVWGLFKRLDRAEADAYLKNAAENGFNAVQAVALWNWRSSGAHNAYGDHPLASEGKRYDPSKPLTTPGHDPADARAYDFWDHVDYIVDRAAARGLYVIIEPTWGYYVSGTNSYARDMSSNIFTSSNARTYGQFLGARYGSRPNVIWMLGGDRSAVYENGDFRGIWRSLAEGIGRGATGVSLTWNKAHPAWDDVLMTYHATRRDHPGSLRWFHDDAWLDFNGVQSEYHSIVSKTAPNWAAKPTKPLAVLEARYEGEYSTDGILFTGAYKQRYQLYHAVLGGSASYAYGHTRLWDLDSGGDAWEAALDAPGRRALKPVWALLNGLTDAQLLDRVPDQTLIDGRMGSPRAEDLLVAMRGGDRRFALAYSTDGRPIRIIASKLAAGTADAYWFNPRTGKLATSSGAATTNAFARVATGAGAPVANFDPPGPTGAGNDWMLKLVVR